MWVLTGKPQYLSEHSVELLHILKKENNIWQSIEEVQFFEPIFVFKESIKSKKT